MAATAARQTAPKPKFGDTAGAAVLVERGLLTQGDSELMKDIEWIIMAGDRWGLVGQNGGGKSTLLSTIAGYKELDEGRVVIKSGTRVGYLVQTAVSGSTRTVYDEACSQMDTINSAKRALEAAERRVETDPMDMGAVESLLDAQTTFEAVGGLTQDKTLANVLGGLGFSQEDQQRPCSEFSGGWQMRIALARLLLSDADLLLLDEPTNHLEVAARNWLTGFLKKFPGTMLVVSHDEELLRGLGLTGVAEVKSGRLDIYKGCDYRRFLIERVERVRAARARYERQQQEIERLQGFVDRFGAKATKASAAQSRVKRIEKLEAAAEPAPDSGRSFKANIQLPPPPPCHKEQISLLGASFGWGDQPVVKEATLKVEQGMRIAILGPNGAGKSTTLRALAGQVPLSAGERRQGDGLQLGMFTQDLAQDLPQDAVALDHLLDTVREHNSGLTDEQARATLGALGLGQGKALRKIGWLSGGEKARVALAIFMLIPYNLLLLDEPSNHLDEATLDSLVDAVKRWKGTSITVSHNKRFVKTLRATHTVIVKDGQVTYLNRPPEDKDWDWGSLQDQQRSVAAGQREDPNVRAERRAAHAETDKDRKKRGNAPRRITKIQEQLGKIEAKVAGFDEEMFRAGSDLDKVMDISKLKQVEEDKAAALYAEWDELEALLQGG